MEELMKQIMGESYKEGMTQDEVQAFFKNQVLGDGKYVNKEHADAEQRKLQEALDKANLDLQNKMTDDEKKEAADKALLQQLEDLKKELAKGKVDNSIYKAMSSTAKGRTMAGIEENDKEFSDFITAISGEDEVATTKIASYVNTLIEKAYEKGKSDMTKNKLGGMGNFHAGSSQEGQKGKTEIEELASSLAKGTTKKVDSPYFK